MLFKSFASSIIHLWFFQSYHLILIVGVGLFYTCDEIVGDIIGLWFVYWIKLHSNFFVFIYSQSTFISHLFLKNLEVYVDFTLIFLITISFIFFLLFVIFIITNTWFILIFFMSKLFGFEFIFYSIFLEYISTNKLYSFKNNHKLVLYYLI